MHGLIFASLHDYTRDRLGPQASREIFAGRTYVMSEQHPDHEFTELLAHTAKRGQTPIDDALRDFGAFTVEHTFARLYPAYFKIAGNSKTFLLGVETHIHELVRATIPDAHPPALRIRPADDESVTIEYASLRKLCRLLEGLVIGTVHHYNEHVTVTETTCMHHGADACRFNVHITASQTVP